MNILYTGFEPFGTVVVNPSIKLAEDLGSQIRPNCTQDSRVFRVSYSTIKSDIAAALRVAQTELMIMLGVATNRSTVTFEQRAANTNLSNVHDADGIVAEDVDTVRSGPPILNSRIDVPAICDRLNEVGCDCRISNDAGGFLCNRG